MERLPIYVREDRAELSTITKGLSDLVTMAEAMLIAERYGLSVLFHNDSIEWEAVDPNCRCRARANTPAGAILFWDCKRQEIEKAP